MDRLEPACPCCGQELKNEEKQKVFAENGRFLISASSPLLSDEVQSSLTMKQTFQNWRKIIEEHDIDFQKYALLQAEIKAREDDNTCLESEVGSVKDLLSQLKDEVEELKNEVLDLEELARASDRWKDSTLRIGQKSMAIQGKRKDLSILSHPSISTRDRKTVDREYTEITDSIDQLSNKKTELNAEATRLNQIISQTAQQVSNGSHESQLHEEEN